MTEPSTSTMQPKHRASETVEELAISAELGVPTTAWTRAMVDGIAAHPLPELPVIEPEAAVPIRPGFDFWDMWPVARADGSTAILDGRSWWFFLAVPRAADPEVRHDHARIHLVGHDAEGWHDSGPAFADGFTPGSREWSGSAVLASDDETLTIHFTAAGRASAPASMEQRLFQTCGRLRVRGGKARLEAFTHPVQTIVSDPRCYLATDTPTWDGQPPCFRDPGFFRDPADGACYLLFTGTAPDASRPAGVIGLAVLAADGWRIRPPILTALDVNSELERPHIVAQGDCYYLFWSTHAKRFASGIGAPSGLYAMVADTMAGPWRPVNGSGLVAANPRAAPVQAYCWWVTAERDVVSFTDYPGVADPRSLDDVGTRRSYFGGTVAPPFRLTFDGDTVSVEGARTPCR